MFDNHPPALGGNPTTPPTAIPAEVVGCLVAGVQMVVLYWNAEPGWPGTPAMAPQWAAGLDPVEASAPLALLGPAVPGPLLSASPVHNAMGMLYVGDMSPLLSLWQVHPPTHLLPPPPKCPDKVPPDCGPWSNPAPPLYPPIPSGPRGSPHGHASWVKQPLSQNPPPTCVHHGAGTELAGWNIIF